MGQRNYANGFEPTLQEHMLDVPLRWKKPRRIFVNSMSDLFHTDVPDAFIQRVFEVMRTAGQHQYQILTKRSERLLALDAQLPWARHIWMGVSVENHHFMHRIEHLRGTHACVKFLSIEPLLGPLPNLNLRGIDWVIVGGESGPKARPMDSSWVYDIRDQCLEAGTAFFFKQWGGVFKSRTGRELDGRTWDQMPSERRTTWPLRLSEQRA
jgi:protein gp37